MSVYVKLLAIQHELKAPKGQYNAFGKYKYRSCEDIVEAAKPILAKNRCALMMTDRIEVHGDRYYVLASATLVDVETGEKVVATAYAREDEDKKGVDGSQITGAASSYARKYALNGLFAIDDTKDADATNTHGNEDQNADSALCAACLTEVKAYKDANGKWINVNKHVDRSKERFGEILCIDCIEKRIEAEKQAMMSRASEMGYDVR